MKDRDERFYSDPADRNRKSYSDKDKGCKHKSVTFCQHCKYDTKDRDERCYSYLADRKSYSDKDKEKGCKHEHKRFYSDHADKDRKSYSDKDKEKGCKHKSVTFCQHCNYDMSDRDDMFHSGNARIRKEKYYSDDSRNGSVSRNKDERLYSTKDRKDERYYSDPGKTIVLSIDRKKDERYYSDPGRSLSKRNKYSKVSKKSSKDERYYSEPDAKYFEIDYEFLKELRKIAKKNCVTCKKRKERERNKIGADKREVNKEKRSVRIKEKTKYVYCNGRYHSENEHCQLCCKICNKSTETLDSIDDENSFISRSYSSSKCTISSLTKSKPFIERKNSVQSIKSVSFLDSSNDEECKDETNYTAKSFTNDLKKFLLKPATPRFSFRDKLMHGFKQDDGGRNSKITPKLKAIKGLWKSL